MTIHWDALLTVVAVALGSTLAVVVLVTLALIGLSARAVGVTRPTAGPTRRPPLSPKGGTVVAVVCLGAVAAIVLFGLGVMVVR
jgi:hypothetical protein